MPADSPSVLPRILTRSGDLTAQHPVDRERIKPGRIYVAPPDRHLLLEPGIIRLIRGPKENGHRPAVDPLFRTAARAYGPRVVGVVLSGSLDDGTAGLIEIKRRGGVAIAQDPADTYASGMPTSAIQHVEVDHVLSREHIAATLTRIAHEKVSVTETASVSGLLDMEADIDEMDRSAMQDPNRPGTPSGFTCPECHGALWEIEDGDLLRFRCRVGHAYSLDSLHSAQSEAVEAALWSAMLALKERSTLARRMAKNARHRGQVRTADRYEARAEESDRQAALLLDLLQSRGSAASQDVNKNTGVETDARDRGGAE
jgi:two-component system chemotaxis response regulator CheB